MSKTFWLALLVSTCACTHSVFAQGAVTIVGPLDGSGNVLTTATLAGSKTNDNAAPAADLVPVVGAIASTAAQAYTTGRLVLPRVNLFGHAGIFLTDPTTGAAVAAATDVTAGGTKGTTGPQIMVLHDAVLAALAETDDEPTQSRVDGMGRTWTRKGDLCGDHARITHAVISESTAATNEIVALASGETIYVCSYKWVTTLANSLKWVRGTGTDCGTGTTDIEGAQPYGANGGTVENGGGSVIFAVTSANALCLTSSAATAHGGRVSYVRTAAP